MPTDIQKTLEAITQFYASDMSQRTFNAMVIGEPDAGKTTLFKTCPRPIFIDSFDPGGTRAIEEYVYHPETNPEGFIFVDTSWEAEDPTQPEVMLRYENTFKERKKAGFFEMFGTYGVDSLTTFYDALLVQILKKENRLFKGLNMVGGEGQGMRIQDWGTILFYMKVFFTRWCALPCNFMIMAHIAKDKNEVTGEIINTIAVSGQTKDKAPAYVDEVYTLLKAPTAEDKHKRVLLTQDDKKWMGRSRLSKGGLLDAREKPDICNLLKKANRPYGDVENWRSLLLMEPK